MLRQRQREVEIERGVTLATQDLREVAESCGQCRLAEDPQVVAQWPLQPAFDLQWAGGVEAVDMAGNLDDPAVVDGAGSGFDIQLITMEPDMRRQVLDFRPAFAVVQFDVLRVEHHLEDAVAVLFKREVTEWAVHQGGTGQHPPGDDRTVEPVDQVLTHDRDRIVAVGKCGIAVAKIRLQVQKRPTPFDVLQLQPGAGMDMRCVCKQPLAVHLPAVGPVGDIQSTL